MSENQGMFQRLVSVLKDTDDKQVPINKVGMDVDVHELEEDGVDHINIHPVHSKTELGQLLSNNAKQPFVHPLFGSFATMEGFWNYIKTKGGCDSFRLPNQGYIHRKRASELKTYRIENFQDIILEGIYFKIMANEHLKQLLLKNELPIVHYWITGKVRAVPPGLAFMNHGIMSIRTLLLENKSIIPVDVSKEFGHMFDYTYSDNFGSSFRI